MTTPHEVYLIDGSSYIYRAFYAMRELTTSKGLPTNATYIFARMLLKLLKDKCPEHIVFVLDSRGLTHRHTAYPPYKANRQRMPETLQVQVPYIIQVVESLGIPTLQHEGQEADDLIATLARHYGARGERVIIVSGDKDLMQLVDENTLVWDTLKDTLFDSAAVQAKFGVPPSHMADLLAIMGDSSDNVPGVPGIGQKGATGLIQERGHLEDILGNLDLITAKRQRQALEEHADLARLSLDLVRLDRDVELPVDPESLSLGPRDENALLGLFEELEFRALIQELGVAAEPAPSDEAGTRFTIVTELAYTAEAGLYCLPGVGFSLSRGKGDTQVCLDPQAPIPALLEEKSAVLCMHDAKEARVLALRHGYSPRAQAFDTMLAAYCIDASTGTTRLEDLARKYLGKDLPGLKELLGSGRSAREACAIPAQERGAFLAGHAAVLPALKERLSSEMEKVGVQKIFHEIELPLLEVLSEMEATGVMLDARVLSGIAREIDGTLETLQGNIYALAGREFNINSPKQLGEILFDELGLPVVKKTKTGSSTDTRVLEALASKHDLPAHILEYRGLTKLKNTYVDSLPRMVDPVTRRIHSHFNQAATATGRISSSEPNLQNIPIRTETGRRIRAAFVAPPGFKILSADYSQIELRVLAHITGDATLLDSFARGLDIHARTASEVFGVALKEVSPEQRRAAKTINFGIIYGMGPHKLAGELKIKQATAKHYIENYLAKYPGVRRYMEEITAQAASSGHVTTLLGRRRSIPEIASRNFNEREGAKRIAINTPIQGSAADIIKIAMVHIHEKMRGMQSRMILQVHDELVFEAASGEIEDLTSLVVDGMESAFPLKVPLTVEVGLGANWSEAH